MSHAGECLLSALRDGTLSFTPAHAAALLTMCDAIRVMLDSVSSSGGDGDDSYSELAAQIMAMANGADATASAVEPPSEPEPEPGNSAPDPEPVPAELDALANAVAAASAPDSPDSPLQAPAMASVDGPQGAVSSNGANTDTSIRVDVKRLDTLMNLVGELVLARNQVLQFHSTQDDPNFQATSQQLNLITTELQEGVMKTRMQPIGNVWNKFPRIVRDLARRVGKQVRLEMEGERDRARQDASSRRSRIPLTHIVRNCGRPRDREPGGAHRRRASPQKDADAARVPRGRPGHHRDRATTAPASTLDRIKEKAIAARH